MCFNGALQVWAANGWGSLTDFLSDQLDQSLAPYLISAERAMFLRVLAFYLITMVFSGGLNSLPSGSTQI